MLPAAEVSSAFHVLSTCQEGRDVLKEIERLKIKIVISDLGYPGLYQPQSNRITLDQNLSTFERASTLSHEVRHAWQFDTLGWHDRLGCFETLRTHINVSRMLEGDAYAFQNIVEDSLRAAEAKINYAASPQIYCHYFMSTQKELDNYDRRRIESHEEYVKNMSLICEHFSPKDAKDFLKESFNANISLSRLRRLCIMGFQASSKNYLETVSAEDLWRSIHMRADGSFTFKDITSIDTAQMQNYRKVYRAAKVC